MNLLAAAFWFAMAVAHNGYLMYVGTYTGEDSKGIYAWRFDPATGGLKPLGLAGEVVNPSFLTIHPNHKFLYAVSELGNDGKTNGLVTAFSIDAKTGALTKLNTVSSGGGGACHLVVDRTGKSLVVANYGTGGVAAFPIHEDGSIGEASSKMQHSGSSVNPRRQKGPHAHGVYLSPDNRFVMVPDLGLDKIMIYRLDAAHSTLTPNDPPFVKVEPGSGPRHFAFQPGGKHAYLVNEMGSRVTAFDYDPARGVLKEIQTISTLPKGFSGENNSAEIEIDVKGRYLYASNRGHDSIAIFSIAQNGTLRSLADVPTQGQIPRNFHIDPTGAYLFAANQKTNNIVVFRVDPKSGLLSAAGKSIDVHAPVCVRFVPAG